MLNTKQYGFFWSILLISTFLLADDTLTTLSFDDLMDVEVSVASKKSESIYNAPGIISSYSKSDIQNLARYSLKDLADITPGYSSTRLYGEPGLGTRGVMTSSFNNNRHLVLLDGVPVNHLRANKAPVGEELSLFGADRVEFLRGPASSLYGTGAYYGVINVVPYIPEEKGTTFRSRIGFGGPTEHRFADLSSAYRGNNQQFWAVASYDQSEPSKSYLGDEKSDNFRYWDDLKALSVQASYKITDGPATGIGAGTYYLSRATGLGEHWNGDFSHELNDIHWETFIAFLRLNRPLSDMISLNSYVKYNRSTETGTFTPLAREDFENYTGGGELLYHYEVPVVGYEYNCDLNYDGSVLDVTGGVDFDWRYQPGPDGGTSLYFITGDSGTTPYIQEEVAMKRSDDFRTASIFLQVKTDFPVLAGLQVTGGIRTDIGNGGHNKYTQLSPRVGVVQQFTDYLNLKMLYGTALLAPGIKEVTTNAEALNRAPELHSQVPAITPESFSTFETGLVFFKPLKTERHLFNVKAEIAGFVNQSLNEIFSDQKTGEGKTENFFVNTNDTVIAQGIECEIRAESDFGVGVFSNYAYAKARNRLNTDNHEDIPTHKINGGVTYRSERTGIYSSIVGRFVNEYSVKNAPNRRGFSTADFVAGWKSRSGVGSELKMTNVTDEQFKFPVGSTSLIPMQGRQIQLSLTAEF